ncbi:MAG TPA: MFS transporter [Polyangiaceae bacterium]
MTQPEAPPSSPGRTWSWLTAWVDVRADEVRAAAGAFGLLLLILTAHTILETARDALLIVRIPPRSLGMVYVAVAACVLPAAALASRVSTRLGVRRALAGALAAGALGLVGLYLMRTTEASVVLLYVATGLVGGVVVPQFWSLVGSVFTVTQGRRLLGPIAAAGVIGATLGSTSAVALLAVLPVKGLLLVSAGVMALAAAAVLAARGGKRPAAAAPGATTRLLQSPEVIRREPFLGRIALLVVASTATAIAVDYFFKWSVAHWVAPEHVAHFVARYYAVLNGLSLVTQLLVSGALVRRMGVATAIVVTPLLFVVGGVGALVASGALAGVLFLRAVDGALINSLHRVTSELVYLPVPTAARARAKPILDGALARITQAACGGAFLLSADMMSPRWMAAVALVLALAWLGVAVTTRRPYLDLLRRAIPGFRPEGEADPLDLEAATELVQMLASEDPLLVVGAMNALARRGRGKLVPALILLHEDDAVLLRALVIFAESTREDWLPRARRLLAHPHVEIRIAATRALAQHGSLDLDALAGDTSPRVQGYAAVHASLRQADTDPVDAPAIVEILGRAAPAGDDARLGVLAAVADVARSRRLVRLLLDLAERALPSREWSEGLSRAATAQRATVLIPDLLSRLSLREGREAVRDALVSLGPTALGAAWDALRDETRQRSLRVHLPNTIARFGTRHAAELLLERVETERDGLVRYKCIRALQRLTTSQRLELDRPRVERLAQANLVEHFRLIGLRAAFDEAPPAAPTGRLLVRLLDDKILQSFERVFRLLQIAHPGEELERVRLASRSPDRRVRANAVEFLDTLLVRRDERPLSALLRVACEDVSLVRRRDMAASLLAQRAPSTVPDALDALVRDGDATVRALAELHQATLAGQPKRVAVSGGASGRLPVELETEPRLEVVGA